MKSLQAFWKLFRKKKWATKTEHREKEDIGEHERNLPLEESSLQEEKTQPIIKKNKEKIYIQVGLDFGTSATKVVFSQLGKRPFRVLNFNHNLPHVPSYCIPSIGCVGENGGLLLGVSAARALLNQEWDTGLQRLKVVVAGKYDNSFRDPLTEEKYYHHFRAHKKNPVDPEMLTAVFLAYVIRNTRRIIMRLPEYRGYDLDFAFNICMPIDHFENKNLKQIFERTFTWAELIEDQWSKNDKGFNPLNSVHFLKDRSLNREQKVFAVPEAVASFASYLISLRKRKGLHAIIDLGAGTIDLSICNLFLDRDGIKNYWYAARNLPRGTIRIERALALNIIQVYEQKSCTLNDIYECLNGLSSTCKQDIGSQKNKGMIDVVYQELCNLRGSKEYKQTWGSAYKKLKKDVMWKDVEIFVCGGGSNLPQVDNAFSKPWWEHLKTEYRVSKLPVPDNYEPGNSEAPFERMSVAYGLAIPFPQLDDFTLPGGSPDHTPASPPVIEIDVDELYPRR